MLKCIAIDDEPLALRQIESYIGRESNLDLVALCSSAKEAQGVLEREQIDLMFVDINMPDMSGVEFVRTLERAPMLIFTTAYSEYAVESFRLDAVDYLLKPFSYDDFSHAVRKASSIAELVAMRERLSAGENAESEALWEPNDKSASAEENDSISIKADYKVSIVKFADIIYIESVGEYIRLHLKTGKPITTLFRLKNMEHALPSSSFMRVHRSYIVNLKYVKGYARGRVYLENDEYVPLSANYKDQFREFIDSKGV